MHFDDYFLEILFQWCVSFAFALNKVAETSCLLECREFLNILQHLPFQNVTSKVGYNVFQETVVQKIPVGVQMEPDAFKG